MAAAIKWLGVLLLVPWITQLTADNRLLLPLEDSLDFKLMAEVSKILCRAHIKVLFVYDEDQITHDHSGEILRKVTKCDISYISLRTNSGSLQVKDDGILMYMVMIVKDISQPLKLSLINKKSAAKHHSHVILLVWEPKNLSKAWLRASFKQFWAIWLLNIVIVFWRTDRLHVYRYNPFKEDFLLPMHLERGELPTLNQLFPKDLPNMQRKSLRMCLYMDDVRAFEDQNGMIVGSDGLLSDFIAQRLSATRTISHPIVNQSVENCATEVANEIDDVAMNTRFLSPESFGNRVESTITHNRDDLCVIVPKAKAESLFWNIFRSFKRWVWLLILISLLLATIFCKLVYRRETMCVALQLFAGSLTQPVSKLPRSNSMRLFLVFWLYFGTLICTAFKGNLTSMLVYRKSLPDINDFGMLANSPYKIMIRSRHNRIIKRFLNDSQQHAARIKQLMLEVPDSVLAKHFNQNDQSYAYLEKYHIAAFQVNARQHMRMGRPLFHLMKSCLVPFHAVYTVPYGSPYLGFFNTLIRGAHEFGFERYWDRIMNAAFIKSGTKLHNNGRRCSSDDPVVLKLEHFHAVFFLWAIGVALAFLVFLWELQVAHNWSKAKRNRKVNMQT